MLWDGRILSRPDLADLSATAATVAACSGDGPWRVMLDRLIASLRDEAGLNEIGLTFAYVQLTGLLRQRQRACRLWKRHPQILAMPVNKPVIVIGQMRSGTTRLQRLFGCDPRFAHTRFFEVMQPVAGAVDLRIPKSWAQIKLLETLNPALAVVHPVSATAVEEAFGLLSFSFYGAHFEAQWRVPAFARQWEDEDRTWVYREFRQLLQTIAWQRGDAARSWVLKAPQFMEDLDTLLDVFPDARLIFLGRDPVEVVGSSASLVWNQMRLQSDCADRAWIGSEWLRKTARREQLCTAARARLAGKPHIDVTFSAMNRDWRAEMGRIYRFLDLELTPGVERRMEAYVRGAARSGFNRHVYRLDDFGLNAEQVRNAVGT